MFNLSKKGLQSATIAIFVLLILLLIATNNVETQQASQTTSSDISQVKESTYYPSIGDTIVLGLGGDTTWVGVTKKSYDDLVKYVGAKDTYGLYELLSTGMVLGINNGTKANYISTAGFGVVEVRVLEGEYAGQLVYVVSEALKPQTTEE